MIRLKTPAEIETMAEGGKLLGQFLDELSSMVVPGATGTQLEERARELIKQHHVKAAFLGYKSKGHPAYPAALCISINEGVVHGVPKDEPFAEGDLVGVDMGIIYNRLYLDSARTVIAGQGSPETKRLLDVTTKALELGIAAAQVGHTTGHIGEAVQRYVEDEGFGVVRELVGHGVGYGVHEEPQVPNFGFAGEGAELRPGLVIAIEPMVTIGDPAITTAPDGWTIVTEDGSLAAHQEHTVAITESGPRIVTAS